MNTPYYVYAISSMSVLPMILSVGYPNITMVITNRTTKPYRPFSVIYFEKFHSRAEARSKEKFPKGGSGKKFLYSIEKERMSMIDRLFFRLRKKCQI